MSEANYEVTIFDMCDNRWVKFDTMVKLSCDIILGNGFTLSPHPYGDGKVSTQVTDGTRSVAFLKTPREAECFAAACLAFNMRDQVTEEILKRGREGDRCEK